MFNSLTVVIFEDEFLLAEALTDSLTKLGCSVSECCGNVDDAMLVAKRDEFDLAIVDMDLGGESAAPILDWLAQIQRPYLVATAAFDDQIPERFAHAPRLTKPYGAHQLEQAIRQMRKSGKLPA